MLIGERLAQVDANDKPVLFYVTCPTLAVAENIGWGLVERGLAACVNILPEMLAIYKWQGARHCDREAVLIVKTRSRLADAVVAAVKNGHPYDNPAILRLPIDGGSQAFLDWIVEQSPGAGEPG